MDEFGPMMSGGREREAHSPLLSVSALLCSVVLLVFGTNLQGVLLPIDEYHRPVVGEVGGDEVPTLTGAQIRGARGLLDWSLAQLAAASGVSVSTIKRMEDGSEGSTRASKSEAVRRALQTGGVSFRTVEGATWISR